MKTETLISIGISVIVFCLIVCVLVLIVSQMGIQINDANKLTYEKCCGGNVCSDTYYDSKDNKCKFGTALVLAFCVRYSIPLTITYLQCLKNLFSFLFFHRAILYNL